MGPKTSDFTVTVGKEDVVSPSLPMQDHWLPLSNLDLLLPPLDVNCFFFYKKVEQEDGLGSATHVLKHALAQTLISYYAFAGEIRTNISGEPEILCNNRGVDFLDAYAEVELSQLNLHRPDESLERMVPRRKHGVFAVQATELKCGSIVLGCTMDHRVADAYSANMFYVAWAKMARSGVVPPPPSFRRSLLNPRRPGHAYTCQDKTYVPLSTLPPPQATIPGSETLTSRIYYVRAKKIEELQLLASSNGRRRTKLEAFSAFLWKTMARSEKRGGDKVAKIGVVVDGRMRLSEGDSDKEALMATYFGNVLSLPMGGHRVGDLNENSLSWAADEVHRLLEPYVTKEHFLDLIDWVEANRPEPAVAKIYTSKAEEGPAFVVSSGQRFPVTEVDFGWGRPVFGTYHFPWGGDAAGYVMPMPSTAVDGDWVAYLNLLPSQLDFIEAHAGDVFKPLTSDYLKVF